MAKKPTRDDLIAENEALRAEIAALQARLQARNHRQPVTYYRSGVECPGCTGINWLIGRHSAECGHCGWTLPLGKE